jgi:hypothetical protein
VLLRHKRGGTLAEMEASGKVTYGSEVVVECVTPSISQAGEGAWNGRFPRMSNLPRSFHLWFVSYGKEVAGEFHHRCVDEGEICVIPSCTHISYGGGDPMLGHVVRA